MQLKQYIEALIFSAEKPISLQEISNTINEIQDNEITVQDIEEELRQLIGKYEEGEYAMHIVPISNGFQFMTKPVFHEVIFQKLKNDHQKRLSTSAMETLAIIAYKQPVEKMEVEFIRGVNCDYTIKKLLEKDLVEIVGRSDKPGRPLIYKTSEKFMDYFGIRSIKDLPKPKEFSVKGNEIGETEDMEDWIKSEEE